MTKKYYLTKDKEGILHLWLDCTFLGTENVYCDKMIKNNYEWKKNPFTNDEILKIIEAEIYHDGQLGRYKDSEFNYKIVCSKPTNEKEVKDFIGKVLHPCIGCHTGGICGTEVLTKVSDTEYRYFVREPYLD